MQFHVIDVTASACSIILVTGAVVLAALGKPIPPELTGALGSAMTWLFVRAGVVLKDTETNGK